ncbi:MAG: SdpI family protein [Oceanicaulis sp.]
MVRKALTGSIPFLLVMAGFAAWGWIATPEGAQVPVHWDASGAVNRTGGKVEAFVVIPAVALGFAVLFGLAPLIDPRGKNLRRSASLYYTAFFSTMIVLTLVQGAMTLSALGLMDAQQAAMPKIVASVTAVVLIAVGNVLGKARPNWFAGFRTPWTLTSDKSWDVTHRWAGRLMVLAGAAGLAALWLLPDTIGWTVLLGGAMAATIVPIVISYLVWRKDPDRETFSARE